ncbi:tRNA (5-methylaminomethyl-2-thiouridine)(34)-methyltransferase MnmD [Psychromarinibacter sp. S121]|uniref:tRNA (5-methylaminomethyl-2-thiouridine)(34)-methyltransferase MnmD n=1 Tax=Psychromarinibacter sp. S121 TaxID=3415127 RepID=UPI003C7DB8A9
MQTPDPSATLWRDGAVPVSARFDDPYYSLDNGLAETRHVFLDGNDLPARFREGFHIAELGFGTGLNMLTALQAWRASGATGPLRFTSFEAFPLPAADLSRALASFPELGELAAPLVTAWERGETVIETGGLRAEVVIGDARETLSAWNGAADAWFLDGFSPAKNPELWEAPLLEQVARHTAPGGTAATYTAAGFVRRNLADAGFAVERRPGFGRKRHMTVARLA